VKRVGRAESESSRPFVTVVRHKRGGETLKEGKIRGEDKENLFGTDESQKRQKVRWARSQSRDAHVILPASSPEGEC